jgi:hypothetical protein
MGAFLKNGGILARYLDEDADLEYLHWSRDEAAPAIAEGKPLRAEKISG